MFSGQPAHSDRTRSGRTSVIAPVAPKYPWSSVHIGVDDYDRHLRVGHPTIGVDSDSERLEDICCLSPVLQCRSDQSAGPNSPCSLESLVGTARSSVWSAVVAARLASRLRASCEGDPGSAV